MIGNSINLFKETNIMKKLFYMISAAAFLASFSSCGKIEQENTPNDNFITDGATTLKISATVPQTKTYMNSGEVKWVKGDFIQIFAEDGSYKFTDAVTYGESGAPATYDFTVADWPADKTPLYAVYAGQYAQQTSPSTYSDGVFTASLSANQTINHKNSFAKTANLSVGELVNEGASYSIAMKNVGGLFKFSISTSGMVSNVKIEDVDGGALAGKVNITLENGIPKAEAIEGKSAVVLKSNITDAGELFPKADYYACVLPGTYTLKVTVTYTDGNTKVLEAKSPVTVKRNEWVDLGVIDNVASSEEPEQPEDDSELTLTFDFTTWPFSPTLNKGTNNKQLEKNAYTFTDNGVEYPIEIYAPNVGYYYTSNYLRFNCDTGKGAYIKLPAVADKALSKLHIAITNTVSKGFYLYKNVNMTVTPVELSDAILNAMGENKGGVAKVPQSGSREYELTNTEKNTSYYLYSEDKNMQMSKIVLTYSK